MVDGAEPGEQPGKRPNMSATETGSGDTGGRKAAQKEQ